MMMVMTTTAMNRPSQLACKQANERASERIAVVVVVAGCCWMDGQNNEQNTENRKVWIERFFQILHHYLPLLIHSVTRSFVHILFLDAVFVVVKIIIIIIIFLTLKRKKRIERISRNIFTFFINIFFNNLYFVFRCCLQLSSCVVYF